VLMGALCECYRQGTADVPYLMPENQAAFMFMERIPHKLRVEREWPEATSVSSLRSMRWTLRLGTEVLEEIELLDYPGELYRIAFGERTKEEADAHRTELNEFLEHVTGADTLIVLLNVKDTMNLGANPRNAETVWITRGILDFAKKVPGIKRTALMLTQADRYRAALDVDGGTEGFYAKRLPMMKTLYPDLNVIAVSAVSATDGEGRPAEGYSVEGCREVMRVIVERPNAAADAALRKCEGLADRIKNLNETTVMEFPFLVGEYSVAYGEFEKAAVNSLSNYWRMLEQMRVRIGVYEELRDDVQKCVTGRGMRELAERDDCWREILQKYDGVEDFVASIRKCYAARVREDRAFLAWLLGGLVVLACIFVLCTLV